MSRVSSITYVSPKTCSVTVVLDGASREFECRLLEVSGVRVLDVTPSGFDSLGISPRALAAVVIGFIEINTEQP